MHWYLLNILLLVMWTSLLSTRGVGGKRMFVVMASFQWILLSGLRHISIGADTFAYSVSFNNTLRIPWRQVFGNLYNILFLGEKGKDPGYTVFEKTTQLFTTDYQMYLMIIAVLFTCSLGLWIYRNSSDPFFSFLIYSCFFYAFFAITGHRQTIATALVVLIGYEYVKKQKFWRFLLLVLSAALIHKSALVFLPFYFLANKRITSAYVGMVIGLFPILFVFRIPFSNALKAIGGYDVYGTNGEAGTWTFTAIMLLIATVALWRGNVVLRSRPENRHLYNALFVSIVFIPLTYVNPSAMRAVQYFSIFIMLLIPELINSFKGREKVFVYFFAASLLIIMFVKGNPRYLFFWQS